MHIDSRESRQNNHQLVRWYRVDVGHASVRVEGRSHLDAICQAKRRFCQEMPRLWDVIQRLGEDRFQVRLLR